MDIRLPTCAVVYNKQTSQVVLWPFFWCQSKEHFHSATNQTGHNQESSPITFSVLLLTFYIISCQPNPHTPNMRGKGSHHFFIHTNMRGAFLHTALEESNTLGVSSDQINSSCPVIDCNSNEQFSHWSTSVGRNTDLTEGHLSINKLHGTSCNKGYSVNGLMFHS